MLLDKLSITPDLVDRSLNITLNRAKFEKKLVNLLGHLELDYKQLLDALTEEDFARNATLLADPEADIPKSTLAQDKRSEFKDKRRNAERAYHTHLEDGDNCVLNAKARAIVYEAYHDKINKLIAQRSFLSNKAQSQTLNFAMMVCQFSYYFFVCL